METYIKPNELSVRAWNVLRHAELGQRGRVNLRAISRMTESQFLQLHNCGRKTTEEIGCLLEKYGFQFRDDSIEMDWQTKLWVDVLRAYGHRISANTIKLKGPRKIDKAPIELLRTRFEQMLAERSKS